MSQDFSVREWFQRKKVKVDATVPEKQGQVLQHIFSSQCAGQPRATLTAAVRASLTNKLPCVLHERELPCRKWQKYDKAFACTWVNDTHVLVGTKCNNLVCLDVKHGLAKDVALPPKPQRPPELAAASTTYQSCGIHAVKLNAAGDLMATGGDDPCDTQVFRVCHTDGGRGQPDFQPVQTLVGHQDWVFGAAWLTERHLVTGSRDSSIKLWSVEEGGERTNLKPLESRIEHRGKVRDVVYSPDQRRLATLGSDGQVLFWDQHLRSVHKARLDFERELVCMAAQDSLVAVGSQSHVTLLDCRAKAPRCANLDSLDPQQGVRSLGFLGHLLSCGSGRGRISFYDLRASGWIDLELHSCTSPRASAVPQAPLALAQPYLQPQPRRQWLEAGPGWLCHNHIYEEHFAGQPVHNACYAHEWDATRTRLFACGGPLAFGLKGCYMAVWE